MNPVRISELVPEMHEEVARLLAAAFVTNPLHIAAFGSGALEKNEAFFRMALASLKGSKSVALLDSRVVGVIHWIDSPSCQFSAFAKLRMTPSASTPGYAETMQKTIVPLVMLFFCMGSAICDAQTPTAPTKLDTDEQKTFYALGLLLGDNVQVFDLKPEELAIVKAGMTDAVTGAKPQVDIDTFGPKVNDLARKRASAGADDAKRKGQEFADKVALEKDATKTASGIVMRTITAGTGESPTAADVVKVHYEGKLIDGTVFDSSIKRNEPAEFPLGAVVPCWTEALQLMKKGGRSQVVCPAALAYGDRGSPPVIPPGSTLSFEVELLDFHKP